MLMTWNKKAGMAGSEIHSVCRSSRLIPIIVGVPLGVCFSFVVCVGKSCESRAEERKREVEVGGCKMRSFCYVSEYDHDFFINKSYAAKG